MNQTQIEKEIEKNTGFIFKNKDLLHRALIHRSYLNENRKEGQSNERLEFLGDAILEFVVSEHIFRKFEKEDEGHLTTLRSKLVNTISLAETAESIGLGQALYLSHGEESGGGRVNKTLLANTFEALIGAIFLDQGVEIVRQFIEKFINIKIPQTVKKSLKDPKSMLQEFVQAKGYPAPAYKVVFEEGPDHAKHFVVEIIINRKPAAKGEGASKKQATQKAAEAALKLWEEGKI